jgi:hypothetical protein
MVQGQSSSPLKVIHKPGVQFSHLRPGALNASGIINHMIRFCQAIAARHLGINNPLNLLRTVAVSGCGSLNLGFDRHINHHDSVNQFVLVGFQ